MPVNIKDYTWNETLGEIIIKVPLRGVHSSRVDLFTSNMYIKAHYEHFLFEIFLLHEINVEKSKCTFEPNEMIFELVKMTEELWNKLEKDLSKQEKLEIKIKVLEDFQLKYKEKSEQKQKRKTKLSQFAVEKAINMDTKHHQIMDERRDKERNDAMEKLETWRVTKEQPRVDDITDDIDEAETSSDTDSDVSQSTALPIKPKLVRSDYVKQIRKEEETRKLPELRKNSQMDITFTPRTFPTPSRESTDAEEQQWLQNITAARRATGFVSEDLRPEEQDPQWCKDKGDEFFHQGNFLGAISAYTHGITLSDKLPSLYSNRAAAHFALGNFNKCMNDCSTALDLMKPLCEGNRISRAKCIARRAAALVRVGMLNKGINEMKVASKLMPEDEKLKKDIYYMERAWEQNPDDF